MEICCLIMDDGRVVTVRVAPPTRVAELRDMVMRALMLHGDGSALDLYVPRGLVQRIVGNDDDFLVDTTVCSLGDFDSEVARECMDLGDLVSKYVKDAPRHPRAIHVLVDLKDAEKTSLVWAMHPALRLSSVLAEDDLEPAPAPVQDYYKRERLSFQDVTIRHRKQLLAALELQVRVERVNTHSTPAPFPVRALCENARSVKTSEPEYVRAYLEDTIGAAALRKRMRLEFVSDVPDLLSVDDERLPFELRGSAVTVVVQDLEASTHRCLHHLQGLRLVVDVERNIDDAYPLHEAQAIAKLIAANARCPNAPVAVLVTNLDSVWTLLWLSPDRLVNLAPMTSASGGMWAITHWLTKCACHRAFHVPYVGNRTRATLSTLLPPSKSDKRALDSDRDVPARVVKIARVDPFTW